MCPTLVQMHVCLKMNQMIMVPHKDSASNWKKVQNEITFYSFDCVIILYYRIHHLQIFSTKMNVEFRRACGYQNFSIWWVLSVPPGWNRVEVAAKFLWGPVLMSSCPQSHLNTVLLINNNNIYFGPSWDRVKVAAKTWCGHIPTSTCPQARLNLFALPQCNAH